MGSSVSIPVPCPPCRAFRRLLHPFTSMICDSGLPLASSLRCSEYPWVSVGREVLEPSVTDPTLTLLNVETFYMLKGRGGPFKPFSGEQMASSWTSPGNLSSFMWEIWPCNTSYKSVVDCVATSDSCLQSALSLLFQQLSSVWTWSAFNIPVSLLRTAGDSDSLLLEDILQSVLPHQPGLCFYLSTMAKSIITIQYLSKIITEFMSDNSNTQIWLSAFSRYIQRLKERYKPLP